jgi:hypothetical protein
MRTADDIAGGMSPKDLRDASVRYTGESCGTAAVPAPDSSADSSRNPERSAASTLCERSSASISWSSFERRNKFVIRRRMDMARPCAYRNTARTPLTSCSKLSSALRNSFWPAAVIR